MTLFRFLSRAPRAVVATIAATGVVSGFCSAALLALINYALHDPSASAWWLIVAMGALAVGKILTGILSKWLLVRYAQQALLELSINLCRRILATPLRLIEEKGAHRVLTALTSDVPVLGAALQSVPALTVNAAVVLGCGAYLMWLYPLGFAAIVVVAAGGTAVYALLYRSAFRAMLSARERRDDLMGSFRSLTEGIKELKLHIPRREEFVTKQLEGTAEELKHQTLTATKKFMFVEGWSQGLFYVMLMGFLLLVPRDLTDSNEVLTGFAFAALYVMNPIWTIIGTAPTMTNGLASLRKLEELGLVITDRHGAKPAALRPLVRSRIEFVNVTFRYGSGHEEFTLGPINLSLMPGELVFLIGGNGSGKTTLVKLLAGLYSPTSGEIRLGNTSITEDALDWYRQHFAVVFFDFHLFGELMGISAPDTDDAANRYLRQLELSDKVTVSQRKFSTTDLSQGQRKRLALLTALLEDRPVCIFDEWAADQDPHYKKIFYSSVLPMLKTQGKTVVVVTHDDRFFGLGDRVIKLEDGEVSAAEQRRAGSA